MSRQIAIMPSHLASKKTVAAVAAVVLIIAATAMLRSEESPDPRLCFVLREGDVSTHLVIEDGKPNGSMTVVERRGGIDVEPPTTGPGDLEGNAFTLADGTRLEFDEARLVWPEGSLLAGSVFVASDCPAL